jgi:predicted metal-dependent HD superfamily phosphohydrolase
MNYTTLLEDVKQYALHFFRMHDDKLFLYHNLDHTEAVVKAATQLAGHYHLNDRDFFVVLTAAWFHDMAYYTGPADGHERNAVGLMRAFLQERKVEESIIAEIEQCILATCLKNPPANLSLNAQIVKDADVFHWGTDDFVERNKLMRKEAETRLDKKISKQEWLRGTIRLLEAHEYKTDYARELLQTKKWENLEKLKQKLHDPESMATPSVAVVTAKEVVPEAVKIKKKKVERPERGIETMFRISSGNHQRLSDMADNKAHIMITTTSIILSVLLSVLLRKLEDNPNLVIPTMLLLVICVVTLVFSILATRPNLPDGTFTQQDIDEQKVNLLFFGNFYRMSYEEYSGAMHAMMEDSDFLYGSLIKDVYSQGVVLSRKYRLLRTAYDVFMFGIIVSVLAFAIATIFFGR